MALMQSSYMGTSTLIFAVNLIYHTALLTTSIATKRLRLYFALINAIDDSITLIDVILSYFRNTNDQRW